MISGKRPSKEDPGGAPLVAARWRDNPPETKVWFYMQALRELGSVRIMTVDLTHSIRAGMESSKLDPMKYLAQRLRVPLKGMPWFFVVEYTQSKLLHMHGGVSLMDARDREVIESLKKVAGDRRKLVEPRDRWFLDRKAVHLGEPDWSKEFGGRTGPFGWGAYTLKQWVRTGRLLGIDSDPISASRPMRRKAREIFEDVARI